MRGTRGSPASARAPARCAPCQRRGHQPRVRRGRPDAAAARRCRDDAVDGRRSTGRRGGRAASSVSWIDVRFAADGATVTRLTVRESVRADAAAATRARRRGRSRRPRSSRRAKAGKGLDAARLRRTTSSTARRVRAAAAAPDRAVRRSRSTSPRARLRRHGRTRASRAPSASRKGQLTRGAGAGPVPGRRAACSNSRASTRRRGRSPRVADGQVTIDAGHIEMTIGRRDASPRPGTCGAS